MNISDLVLDAKNWCNRQRLRGELPSAALSFGWDFSQPWVKALSVQLNNWETADIVFARNQLYSLLKIEEYAELVDAHLVIKARYGEPAVPTPVAVLNHRSWFMSDYAGDLTLRVGPTESVLQHGDSGAKIAVVTDCGRLPLHNQPTYQAVRHACLLITEMTGIQLDFEDVMDASSSYEPLVFDRVNGVWGQRKAAPTQA